MALAGIWKPSMLNGHATTAVLALTSLGIAGAAGTNLFALPAAEAGNETAGGIFVGINVLWALLAGAGTTIGYLYRAQVGDLKTTIKEQRAAHAEQVASLERHIVSLEQKIDAATDQRTVLLDLLEHVSGVLDAQGDLLHKIEDQRQPG